MKNLGSVHEKWRVSTMEEERLYREGQEKGDKWH